MSPLDSAGLDFLIFLQSVAWLDSLTSILGMLRAGGRGLFVEDFAQMDFPLPLRAPAHLALSLPVCGVCCLEFVVLMLDYLHPGFTLLMRSCAWLDSAVPVLTFSSLGAPSPVRSHV